MTETAPTTPPVAPAADGVLAALLEIHRQTAETHQAHQRALADSHTAYLRTVETSLAALTGTPPPPATAVDTAPLDLSQPVTSFVGADTPAALAVAPPSAMHEAVTTLGSTVPATPPGPAPAEQPVGMSADEVAAVVLEVVVAQTGYPAEMLGGHLELAADLGIDSIKRVQILADLQRRIPDLPTADAATMAQLRSLDEVTGYLTELLAADPTPAAPAPAAAPSATLASSPGLHRSTVQALPAAACGLALPGLLNGPLAIVDDGSGLAKILAEKLTHAGLHATANPAADEAAWGTIVLHGMREVATTQDADAIASEAFADAQRTAPRMRDGGLYVTVQDTGGDFGLRGSCPDRAPLGALAALARTCHREWPQAMVKAIDCERGGRDLDAVADALATELLTGGATSDIGLRANGERTQLTDVPETPPADLTPAVIGPESVIVATGGARGVTAAALKELATRHQPRMILLGRTPITGDEPDYLHGIVEETALRSVIADHADASTGTPPAPAEIATAAAQVRAAREVRATLTALRVAGAEVRYRAVDIRDPHAVAGVLADVRRDWGPITTLVHGAGVIDDHLLQDKTAAQYDAVYGTKVAGLRALLDATAHDPLNAIVLFSSLAARAGNRGQSDYAMANEVLNVTASAERGRRPGCLVRSIGWGAWHGGMVDATLAQHFTAQGVPLIPLGQGAAAFADELCDPHGPDRVLLAADDGTDPLFTPQPPPQAGEILLTQPAFPQLQDHAIDGTVIVPMALALEWMISAARTLQPADGRIRLHTIDVLRKIALPGFGREMPPVRLALSAAAQPSGTAVDILGQAPGPHYRATASTDVPDAEPVTAPGHLDPLTDPYDQPVLFHGPAFHAIEAMDGVAADGAAATVHGAAVLGWPEPAGHTDPAAVDGALQVAALWGAHVLDARVLPMGAAEFRLYRPGWSDALLRCTVTARQVEATTATCDIALTDLDGEVRVQLLGVRLVARTS